MVEAITKQDSMVHATSGPELRPPTQKEPTFNADDVMNAALGYQVNLILRLSNLTLSMSDMDMTIQKTGVKNSQSRVEMYRKLLSAQGAACNDHGYDLVKEWGDSNLQWIQAAGGDAVLGYKMFLDSKGAGDLFENVFNSDVITDSDKAEYVNSIAKWASSSRYNLSTFIGISVNISNQLTYEAQTAQNWQSLAESMKPTQIQSAITTLITEIGQATNMWLSIIAS